MACLIFSELKIGFYAYFGSCCFWADQELLYIVKTIRKYFYFHFYILFKICLTYLKDTIISIMQYLDYPVNVSIDTGYESPTDFPSATFCELFCNFFFESLKNPKIWITHKKNFSFSILGKKWPFTL